VAKTIDDTKKSMSSLLIDKNGARQHRGAYFVHRILEPDSGDKNAPKDVESERTELVGRVSFRQEKLLPLPAKFTVPSGPETGVLCLEVGYCFLPAGWGQGFATEALIVVLDSLKSTTAFLSPFTKLYVQGIVSHENPGSIRVLEKGGMKSLGTYEWEAEPIFIAGAWREPCVLVYGQWLIE
jgi:RimJ/RimL family protein N-acetyltransferase